jgi:O-antigen/teichoic acid export membrane protein/peptidoglycan/xylan/chitin deacetylase (PgdA/CDA1 family)
MWAAAGVAVGLDRLLGSRAGNSVGILTYHRIAPLVEGLPRPLHNVPPNQFREQLTGLVERGFHFWPLRRILEYRTAGLEVPPETVILTFDDGYESVYHEALPVLRELHIPATVFVNTAYLDQDGPFPFEGWGTAFQGRAPRMTYRPLSLPQCHELLRSGLVDLGAHTHTHQDFRHRPDDFREDLLTNIEFLRSAFGLTEICFAFPYGSPQFGFATPDLMAEARKVGVLCALTTETVLVEVGNDPFGWGRFNAFPYDTSATLAAKLHGWYSWAPKLVQLGSRHITFSWPLREREPTLPAPQPGLSGRADPRSSTSVIPAPHIRNGQPSVGSLAVLPAGEEPDEEVPERPARTETEIEASRQSALVTRILGLVDQGVVSAVGLFTTVVVGRVAGQEALGLYALGFTLVVIAIAILYSLTSLPYIVFSNRLRGRALAEFSGSVVVHQGVLSAVVVVALASAALLVDTEANLPGLQTVLWVLAGTIPFVLLREFARRVTLAEWRVAETVRLDLMVSILQGIGLLGLAWAGVLSAGTAHAAVGLACAVIAGPWLVQAWRGYSVRAERLLPDWQHNWALGCWEAGSQVVGLAQVYLLHWMLALLLGASATGIFAACLAVVMLSNPFIMGISNLLTPQAARGFAQGGRAEVGRVVGRSAVVVGIGMIAFTLALTICGEQILALLYGRADASNEEVIVLLAVGRLATALGQMIDQGLLAMEHSSLAFLFSFVGLVVTLGAGVWLMNAGGLAGAAWGLLLGSLAGTWLRGYAFIRLMMEGGKPS